MALKKGNWIPREGGPDLQTIRRLFGNNLMWVAAALLVLVILLLVSIRIGRVEGTEVGILLNKMNGKMEVIPQSGVRLYNGITHEFYVLEKTLQTLDMTGGESLKIKTIDGSDVYVALKVQYRIIEEQAEEVLFTSGPGDQYKKKWARHYIRSICRDALGELTTEEFYDSSKRNAQIVKAKQEAKKRLQRFGIQIDDIVMPQKPRFYAKYEELIKKKKLADQAVLEEQSKALAAVQIKETAKVDETAKKNVAIEQFRGEMEKIIIQARAEAERVKRGAEAYHKETTVGAGAEFYRLEKQAEATLAQKKAEAQGIEALKKALEGEGGRNMVKMEYAKKLKDLKITGQPYTIQSRTERFEHTAPAASVRGSQSKPSK
jgi:regulator of protease activity HflC (stomatin/prohibitin superfamily)